MLIEGAEMCLSSQLEVSVADFWGGNGLERCFASLTLLKSGSFTSSTTLIITKSPFGTPVQNKHNPSVTDVASPIYPLCRHNVAIGYAMTVE